MKKQKFLIMWNDHGEKSIREQIGYIIQYDSMWFGIHRYENRERKRWLWVVTELTTGLKISQTEYNTIKEAEDSINEEIVAMCKNYFNGQFKKLFEKDKEMVQKAYLEREEEYASLYWKLYPGVQNERML